MAKRRKNPPDLTLRNLRAEKTRLTKMTQRLDRLEQIVDDLLAAKFPPSRSSTSAARVRPPLRVSGV